MKILLPVLLLFAATAHGKNTTVSESVADDTTQKETPVKIHYKHICASPVIGAERANFSVKGSAPGSESSAVLGLKLGLMLSTAPERPVSLWFFPSYIKYGGGVYCVIPSGDTGGAYTSGVVYHLSAIQLPIGVNFNIKAGRHAILALGVYGMWLRNVYATSNTAFRHAMGSGIWDGNRYNIPFSYGLVKPWAAGVGAHIDAYLQSGWAFSLSYQQLLTDVLSTGFYRGYKIRALGVGLTAGHILGSRRRAHTWTRYRFG